MNSLPESIQNSAVLFHTKNLYRTRKSKNFQRNCLFSFSFKSFELLESNVLSHFLYSRFTSRAFNIAHNACPWALWENPAPSIGQSQRALHVYKL